MPRNDPAGRERLPNAERRGAELKRIGILRDDPPRDVDLLELHSGVARITDLAGDVHRPELAAEHPLSEPLEIGVLGCVPTKIVRLDVAGHAFRLPDRPREVVVAIDQRRRRKDLLREREVGIVGLAR